jgi:hypothetical protein
MDGWLTGNQTTVRVGFVLLDATLGCQGHSAAFSERYSFLPRNFDDSGNQ